MQAQRQHLSHGQRGQRAFCSQPRIPVAGTRKAIACQALPSWIPAAEAAEIQEPAAQRLLAQMHRTPVTVPSLGRTIDTAYVHLPADSPDAPPLLCLHGFDSSSLEFRRLLPLLSGAVSTWAVDLVGWGFTDSSAFAAEEALALRPEDKRAHLYAFWKQHIGRPMALVGASLGGAVAIDFATAHPEAVSKLVLIDAQGFIDGIGPMGSLPRPLAAAGVALLRTEQLREAANQMAYHDKARFATQDARRVGRLHTFLPGWLDANVAFMRSGGYALSQRVKDVRQPALVLWGRNDEILEPALAARFESTLPNGRLVWLEACGHCGHLERPEDTAGHILEFMGVSRAGSGSAATPVTAAAGIA